MDKAIAKQEESISSRFMNKVVSDFSSGVGEVALTQFQRRLAQNYFMCVDGALKKAEQARLKADPKYRKDTPCTWASVNMEKLSQDVVACARIGLDPAQKNHVAVTPFYNASTKKYDMVFIEGYRGLELKAQKYGLDVPDQTIIELVYSTDKFKSIKRNLQHPIENYEWEITNEFDRGEIIGGFYYHAYLKNPAKNKLAVMSLKDILKRKPKYAAAEFWGGEKDKWTNGKKDGKEIIEGWFEKMALKTVARAAYGDITIDSQKIDDDFLKLRNMEEVRAEHEAVVMIEERANTGDVIDVQVDGVETYQTPVVKECLTTDPDYTPEDWVSPITIISQTDVTAEEIPLFPSDIPDPNEEPGY